ncbi:universal stress protein [Hymenobacter rigui]|uniref:Universal stress protein n=1 Tax=Hymenobacter rigui TaxID=334424 RepID=A0A428KCE1_9BACT|nr:universal stress protein [Hymenobacter rigui]RSK44070.1 universal stress protein [Hymenobacter rigui]
MLTFHVLTDFSAAATNALHYAVVLARHVGGVVHLWHMLLPRHSAEAAYFDIAPAINSPAQAQAVLLEVARKVEQYVPCTTSLLLENPMQHLAAALQTKAGQVLVVGNANPAKVMSAAASSTALHLVQTLAQPLLVVPNTYRAGALPRRIVLDTDRQKVRLPVAASTIPNLLAQLTTSSQPLTLSHLPGDVENLLNRIIPSVVGLHVYTSSASPEMVDVANNIQETGLLHGVAHTVTSARHPSIEEGIRYAATRHHADLLAFVTRQRMYPGRQFLHSVTAGLLAHSRIPVLTIPEI